MQHGLTRDLCTCSPIVTHLLESLQLTIGTQQKEGSWQPQDLEKY